MIFQLIDKVAIVCGASKGIGLSIVEGLLEAGVKVLMVSRDENILEKKVQELSLKGTVDFFGGDVSDQNLPEIVIQKVIQKWGRVDILVNNAGGPPMGSFLSHNKDAWESAIETNLMSVVRFSTAVAPIMKQNNWGRIISITSTVAKEPSPTMVLSATVRAGVAAFSKAISTELAPFNITVNVICPGGVLTDRLNSLITQRAAQENRKIEEILKESQESIPKKRFATPKEIADSVLFLLSDSGGYITGVSLSVDGGLSKSF